MKVLRLASVVVKSTGKGGGLRGGLGERRVETEAVTTPLVDPLPNLIDENCGPSCIEANARPPIGGGLAIESQI